MDTDSAVAGSAAPGLPPEPAPSTAAQIGKAALFGELHHQLDVLVLPNVWDVGGAVLLSRVDGVRALATTSAGIAAMLDRAGRPPGSALTQAR